MDQGMSGHAEATPQRAPRVRNDFILYGWLCSSCSGLAVAEDGTGSIAQCGQTPYISSRVLHKEPFTCPNITGIQSSTTTGAIIQVDTKSALEIDFQKPNEWKKPQLPCEAILVSSLAGFSGTTCISGSFPLIAHVYF
jgi:hypothetical protein